MGRHTETLAHNDMGAASTPKWSKKPRRLALAAVAILGCVVSAALFITLRRQEAQWIDAQFRFDAQLRINAIERELASNLAALEALGAFHSGSDKVERIEFFAFTDIFLREQTGIAALAWAPVSRSRTPPRDSRLPIRRRRTTPKLMPNATRRYSENASPWHISCRTTIDS